MEMEALRVWIHAAAADVPAGESTQPLIIALISALAAVVVGAFSALVGLSKRETSYNADDDRANPRGGNERTAVLEQRANDADDRDDIQDRKIEAIMRFLDRTWPDWRP